MKKLLLHVCCGPCSIYVVKELIKEYKVTLFFYNSNIYPKAEYDKRFGELKKWGSKEGLEIIEGDFDQERWFESVKGLENEPEGGGRCAVCFKLRLEEAAKFAKNNDYQVLATTLTSGRNKKATVINSLGKIIAEKYSLEFIDRDWKKGGGQEESLKLSKEQDFYRQDYCGCKFSMRN